MLSRFCYAWVDFRLIQFYQGSVSIMFNNFKCTFKANLFFLASKSNLYSLNRANQLTGLYIDDNFSV